MRPSLTPKRRQPHDLLASEMTRTAKLALDNQTEAAIDGYHRILARRPEHLGAALGAVMTLPLIYDSSTAIEVARARLADGLLALRNNAAQFHCESPGACVEHLWRVNFFLAYQGRDDRELQSLYGDFITDQLRRHFPELSTKLPHVAVRGRRIRVGFASGYFRLCTVGGYFHRWISQLDRSRFETFVYHGSPRRDTLTRDIASHCDHFVDLAGAAYASLEACAKRIREDALDVLIYPELGMDPHSFLLAALRLAPVQCAGWGHPVTSGLASIDFFLSSRDAEPTDAASHYREQLVLLDGLGVSYPQPAYPATKQRGDFGLPEAKTLYLCPQSLFKLHPDFDALLAAVLAGDASGVLVVFEADNPVLTSCFLQRLESVFNRFDLNLRNRVVALPYLRRPEYLEVNRLCDVMLDPPGWSGGNTALDALASGLPIVTFDGRLMRARQSAAMLKRLGLQGLIAVDADDYVHIAHALAHDLDWREAVRGQLRARVGELFDQAAAIESLQNFLETVAHA